MNMCKIFFPFHNKVLINLVTRKMFKTGYITFTTESLASEEESFDKKSQRRRIKSGRVAIPCMWMFLRVN